MEEWIGGTTDGWPSVAWCVNGVEEMCFKSSSEHSQGARITDGSRYIVPGSRCRDCKQVFVEVRGDMRHNGLSFLSSLFTTGLLVEELLLSLCRLSDVCYVPRLVFLHWRPFCSGRRSLMRSDNELCFIYTSVAQCCYVTIYWLLQTISC